MVQFLDAHSWRDLVSKKRKLFFNEEEDFVNAIAQSFSVKADYITYTLKDNLVATLLVYAKGNHIIVPAYFLYTSFWVNDELSEGKYLAHIRILLSELKKKYRNIAFHLDTKITDVRPFQWSGFNVETRFTYLRNLEITEKKYPYEIKKSLKEMDLMGCKVEKLQFSTEIIEQNLAFLKRQFSFKLTTLNSITNFFKRIGSSGSVAFYGCSLENDLIASGIVLTDLVSKIAYTAFVCQTSKAKFGNYSVQAYLYDEIFRDLAKQGYHSIDLLGGNVADIALFKNKLGVELKQYFFVSYSRNKHFVKSTSTRLKKIVKKIIR